MFISPQSATSDYNYQSPNIDFHRNPRLVRIMFQHISKFNAIPCPMFGSCKLPNCPYSHSTSDDSDDSQSDSEIMFFDWDPDDEPQDVSGNSHKAEFSMHKPPETSSMGKLNRVVLFWVCIFLLLPDSATKS